MIEPRRFAHWLSRRVFRLPATRAPALRAVDDELKLHLDGRIDELIAQGMSHDDAVAEARRRFGNLDRFRAELRSIDERPRRHARVAEALDAVA